MSHDSRHEQELREDFSDPEYRYAYVEDHLNTHLAAQIKILREQRGWNQTQLAKQMGTKQPAISRMEDINYGAWKLDTLKKLARAFGLWLKVSFEEFGTFPGEESRFTRRRLERLPYEEDPWSTGSTPGISDAGNATQTAGSKADVAHTETGAFRSFALYERDKPAVLYEVTDSGEVKASGNSAELPEVMEASSNG